MEKERKIKIFLNEGDIVGDQLTYLAESGYKGNNERQCTFRCRCGREFNASLSNARKMNTTSCGCVADQKRRDANWINYHSGQQIGNSGLIYLRDGDRVGKKKGRGVIVKCKCGKEFNTLCENVVANRTISCGCIGWRKAVETTTKHGMTKTPEFKTWLHIKERCGNSNCQSYKDYGARGISVHPLWVDSFEEFFEYMGKRPSSDHSIERIDNNGNYEPGNCKWATKMEQMANKRSNVYLSFDGSTKHVAEWSRETGIKSATILWRIKKGWSTERILTQKKYFRYGSL